MKSQENKNGSALLMVMGFVLVGAILVGGALTMVMNNSRTSARQMMMEQALHLAEAGVEAAAQYIADRNAYIFNNSTPGSGSAGNGAYNFRINKSGFRSYSITSTGAVNGVSWVVNIAEVYAPAHSLMGATI